MSKEELKKEITFFPAYNHVGDGTGKGRHGVTMLFTLTGKHGTAKYSIFTGWLLPSDPLVKMKTLPMGTYIGVYDNNGKGIDYGSSLYGEKIFENFCEKGDSIIWDALEIEYKANFEKENEN